MLSKKQIQQISDEVQDLNALIPADLNDDQLQGHYERAVELAEQTIESNHKGLTSALIILAEGFNPKGEELPELNAAIEKLVSSDAGEGGTSPDSTSVNVLKRSLLEIKVALKSDKVKKITVKMVLQIALEENGIDFGPKDSVKTLKKKLADWLPEEIPTPEPAPEPPKPKAVNLERAIEMSVSLQAYVQAYADQERAKGLDTVRYIRFKRDLVRITRQRLI